MLQGEYKWCKIHKGHIISIGHVLLSSHSGLMLLLSYLRLQPRLNALLKFWHWFDHVDVKQLAIKGVYVVSRRWWRL